MIPQDADMSRANPCGHNPPEPQTCLFCCLLGALPAGTEPTLANAEKTLKLACLHLGKIVDYKGCACPMDHVHLCEEYGRVTLRQCQECPSYQLDDAAMKD